MSKKKRNLKLARDKSSLKWLEIEMTKAPIKKSLQKRYHYYPYMLYYFCPLCHMVAIFGCNRDDD